MKGPNTAQRRVSGRPAFAGHDPKSCDTFSFEGGNARLELHAILIECLKNAERCGAGRPNGAHSKLSGRPHARAGERRAACCGSRAFGRRDLQAA